MIIQGKYAIYNLILLYMSVKAGNAPVLYVMSGVFF